jgi:hypothetical protein
MVTDWGEVYVPPPGVNVGAATGGNSVIVTDADFVASD